MDVALKSSVPDIVSACLSDAHEPSTPSSRSTAQYLQEGAFAVVSVPHGKEVWPRMVISNRCGIHRVRFGVFLLFGTM